MSNAPSYEIDEDRFLTLCKDDGMYNAPPKHKFVIEHVESGGSTYPMALVCHETFGREVIKAFNDAKNLRVVLDEVKKLLEKVYLENGITVFAWIEIKKRINELEQKFKL